MYLGQVFMPLDATQTKALCVNDNFVGLSVRNARRLCRNS